MNTIIIGGGWSGLAAAVRLCQRGQQVHLLESAKQLGGRARSIDWQGLQIDNGQHLMIGAYRQTLALLEEIGADNHTLFRRLPLKLSIHDPDYPTFHMAAGQILPWPLSLAWRLWRDNDAACFSQILKLGLRARRFKQGEDISVLDWLVQCGQSSRLIRQLWEPLCLATLNTPIEQASAAIFSHVLKASFRTRTDADLLIPCVPLGETLPDHAARYIRNQGGQISLQTRVERIEVEQNTVKAVITQSGERLTADHIIVATSYAASQAILGASINLPHCSTFPITTLYLQYPPHCHPPSPVVGLSGKLSQWLFDRSELRPGLVAVVISGPGIHLHTDNADLIKLVASEIHQLWPDFPATQDNGIVIREKRATFACNVDIQRQRPNNRTEITGLWLAGDFVANAYPATLEGAVLNGEQAARQLMEHVNSSR